MGRKQTRKAAKTKAPQDTRIARSAEVAGLIPLGENHHMFG
jgi:hypothetical protein